MWVTHFDIFIIVLTKASLRDTIAHPTKHMFPHHNFRDNGSSARYIASCWATQSRKIVIVIGETNLSSVVLLQMSQYAKFCIVQLV